MYYVTIQQNVLIYDSKQFDGEASAMEILGMWSTPFIAIALMSTLICCGITR